MAYNARFSIDVRFFFDMETFTFGLRKFARAMGVDVEMKRGLPGTLFRRRHWITLSGRFEHVNFVIVWIENYGLRTEHQTST